MCPNQILRRSLVRIRNLFCIKFNRNQSVGGLVQIFYLEATASRYSSASDVFQ